MSDIAYELGPQDPTIDVEAAVKAGQSHAEDYQSATPHRLCCTNRLMAKVPLYPEGTHPTGSVTGMPSGV